MMKKKLASKILLAVLLAAPYGVTSANSIGTTTIDGVEQTVVDVSKNFEIGTDGANVQIAGDRYSLNIYNPTVNGEIYGQQIALDGCLRLYKYTGIPELKIGNDYTDTVTINAIDKNVDGVLLSGGIVDITAKCININTNATDDCAAIWAQNGATANLTAENVNITAPEYGIMNKKAQVNITSKNIEISGDYAAVWAQNSTEEAELPKDAATITLTADNIDIKSDLRGIVAFSNAKVDIDGNFTATAEDVITARGHSVVNINESGNNTTVLNGNINYNVSNGHGGEVADAAVNIRLTDANSSFNGNIIKTFSTSDGKINVEQAIKNMEIKSMNLEISNGAQWNPTKVEEYTRTDNGNYGAALSMVALNHLTSNGGIINLEKMKDQTLEIENLSGSDLTVNVASADNAMAITSNDIKALTVTATRDYSSQLAKQNVEDAFEQVAKQVYNAGESAKTAATKVAMEETDVRGYTSVDVNPENGELLWDTLYKAPNTTNEKISNMAGLAYMAWRAENNDMNKRLGELRDSKGEHGIWTRMVRGESDYRSIDYQYNTYQLGYDEKLSTDSNWTVGGAITYTDGDAGIGVGSAETKHTGFALYGSYLNDDGSFIDLIAKYARLEHDFDVTASTGAGSGSYDTNGYSVSAEYGKRFTQDNGFWIEPQVELTYGKVGSADFVTEKGVKVRQDGMDSLVGRLGFAMGKNFKQGNAYVRASYLYDFEGETSTTFTNGVDTGVFEDDLGGGWWEVGVGTNINLSDATHLYFDVEKTYGGDVATPWQWNLGVRYSF